MTALLELKDVVHDYGGRQALLVDDLRLEPGSILGVAGANGAGKSTLLRIMALLERPTQGRVLFDGQALRGDLTPARRQVALLQQSPFLLERPVLDNLVYGLKVRGDTRDLTARAEKALAWVGLAPDFLPRRSRKLSGGEAQRVALAARLLLEPRALLLDEPTASLDEESRRAILDAALTARHEHGMALCVVSHDHDWLDDISDKVLTLHRGRAVGFGRINVLHGPWVEEADGCVLRLGDGQILTVPPRPGPRPCGGADALLPASAVRPLPEGARPDPDEALLTLRPDRSVLTINSGLHLRFSAPGLALWSHVPTDAPLPDPGEKTPVAVRLSKLIWQ